MSRNTFWLVVIIALIAFGVYVIYPIDSTRFGRGPGFKLGLDLSGGTELIYRADMSKKSSDMTDAQAVARVKTKIEKRVNSFGVSEPVIQIGKESGTGTDTYRMLVQLPNVKDPERAKELIRQTGLLEFKVLATGEWDPSGNGSVTTTQNGQTSKIPWDSADPVTLTTQGQITWVPATAVVNGKETPLTGNSLVSAQPQLNSQTQRVVVTFQWNSTGATLSEQITQSLLLQNQAPLGIFLDNNLISAPRVQGAIKDKGEITGNFTLQSAGDLADTLNSGALDVPLTLIGRHDVTATAGSDLLRKSLFAGFVGLAMVLLYMIVSYRVPGILAGVALLSYGVFLLTIFKLIPVTMSLPGIAGVVISIGMAVDANVLVFERLKEELRAGISYHAAVEKGFSRAWPSIRDSNISTIITCVVLYWFGTTFGATLVQGFALTLFIGVLVSMFTALLVTRTFIRLFIGTRVSRPVKAQAARV